MAQRDMIWPTKPPVYLDDIRASLMLIRQGLNEQGYWNSPTVDEKEILRTVNVHLSACLKSLNKYPTYV
jgi:hypothetical protein